MMWRPIGQVNLVLLCPSAAVDNTGEPAVPPRELDGYLDSLFDPVLACGDAVGMKRDICRWQAQCVYQRYSPFLKETL